MMRPISNFCRSKLRLAIIPLALVALFAVLHNGTLLAGGPAARVENAPPQWEERNGVIVPVDPTKPVAMRKPHLAHTSGVTLTATDSNGVFSTAGSGASPHVVPIPAPSASVVGVNYTLMQIGTTTFQCDPAGGQFRGIYPTNADGDKLQSDNVDGSILNAICVLGSDGSTYYWYTSGMGTWTDAD